MPFTEYEKDKDATRNFFFDWSDWLGTGEQIVAHVVTVPAGITLDSDANITPLVRATLSGGTLGETYEINCEITTNATPAQLEQTTISVLIVEK